MSSRTSSRPSGATRRVQLRAEQHDRSRTLLLDAAESVFGAKGVHAATVKDIAELAGYSVGWVYTCFASKDELFAAVLARRGAEMTAGIAAVCTGGGSPLSRLVELALYEVDFFTARPAFAALYLRSSPIGPMVPEGMAGREVDSMLARALALTEALIAEGQMAGELCAGVAPALARMLSGLVSSYQAYELGGHGVATFEPFAREEFAALVARSFASTAATARAATRASRAATRTTIASDRTSPS